MDKKIIEGLKTKLEMEKASVEKNLERFAKKDEKVEGDWDARFPQWNKEGSGSSGDMEIAASEVEEYATLLPLEHILEIRAKNINSALKKIEDGTYGSCEKCGKKIPIERLKIFPEAKFCLKCK